MQQNSYSIETQIWLDPSGNFSEGKGTTGWATFVNGQVARFGEVKASDYASQEEYWYVVARIVTGANADLIGCESYRLFGHKAQSQVQSAMETCQLIGYLRMVAYHRNIPFVMQDPSQKVRVNDENLTREGVFEKRGNNYYFEGKLTNLHMRDAIRHGIHYNRYGRKK